MDYISKLNYILSELEKKHLFLYFSHKKEDVLKHKEELLKKYKITTDAEFIYVVKCLLAYISGEYDQHTTIGEVYVPSPFIYRYIDNKLYIVTGAGKKDFKYVTKINGIDIKKLIEEYILTIATPTDERIRYHIESQASGFHNLFVLRGLPSIDSKSDNFIYTLDDGTTIKIPYLGNAEPAFPPKRIDFKMESGIPVITYQYCNDEDKVKEIVEKYQNVNSKYLIIDLRGNEGGNNAVINPLLPLLKDKEVFVLTDYRVFSSGVMTMYQIRNAAKCTHFFGGKIGMPLNGFGNTTTPIIVPELDFKVRYSYKFFDNDPFYSDKDLICIKTKDELVNHLKSDKQAYKVRYFTPDQNLELSIDDIRCGFDSVLDYTLLYVRSLERPMPKLSEETKQEILYRS